MVRQMNDIDLFFDRQGNPLTMSEFEQAYAGDRHVGFTEIGDWAVSTVWLGVNYNFGLGPPIIFETMVFADGEWSDLYMERYATEAEAKVGHELAVARVQAILADVDSLSVERIEQANRAAAERQQPPQA